MALNQFPLLPSAGLVNGHDPTLGGSLRYEPVLEIFEFEHPRLAFDDQSPVCADRDIVVATDEGDNNVVGTNHNGAIGYVAANANAELSTHSA
jgi:hypothetical protein